MRRASDWAHDLADRLNAEAEWNILDFRIVEELLEQVQEDVIKNPPPPRFED